MKKYLLIMAAAFLLTACNSEEPPSQRVDNQVPEEPEQTEPATEEAAETVEPTQEELDAKLKEEATQADFVELNGGEAEENKKVFAEGEVTIVGADGVIKEFTLTTKEGNEHGMYSVKSFAEESVSVGDKVKIYGTYGGKDSLGMPVINANVLEKL